MSRQKKVILAAILLLAAPANAIILENGTKIGLNELDTNITLNSQINAENIAVYGNAVRLNNTNISAYPKNQPNGSIGLKTPREEENFSFSTIDPAKGRIQVNITGLNFTKSNYSLESSNKTLFFTSGPVTGSFYIDGDDSVSLYATASDPTSSPDNNNESNRDSSSDDSSSTEFSDEQEDFNPIIRVPEAPIKDNSSADDADENDDLEDVMSKLGLKEESERNNITVTVQKVQNAVPLSPEGTKNRVLNELARISDLSYNAALIETNNTERSYSISVITNSSSSLIQLKRSGENLTFIVRNKSMTKEKNMQIKILRGNGSLVHNTTRKINSSRTESGSIHVGPQTANRSYYMQLGDAPERRSSANRTQPNEDERTNTTPYLLLAVLISTILTSSTYFLNRKHNPLKELEKSVGILNATRKVDRLTERMGERQRLPAESQEKILESIEALEEDRYYELNHSLRELENILDDN